MLDVYLVDRYFNEHVKQGTRTRLVKLFADFDAKMAATAGEGYVFITFASQKYFANVEKTNS